MLLTGVALALAAGLMWGLVFIAPLWLPEYPALLLSAGRYLAFGLIALPLAWFDRRRLAGLSRADWVEAAKLTAIGNLLYYGCLASAIQHAGAALPTMVIGTLPVVIAIVTNLRSAKRGQPGSHGSRHEGRLPWRRLLPSLCLIGAGIALVNHAELNRLRADAALPWREHVTGGLLALGALACWTWYPIRNAEWLRAHADRPAGTWATAQGIATLPLALAAYAAYAAWWARGGEALSPSAGAGAAVIADAGAGLGQALLGPRPLMFLATMFTLGLFASWLGTLCWNGASQRLPTALVGQLIVFETLAALAYAFALAWARTGATPAPEALAGIALLVAGVLWALRVTPPAVPAHAA